MYFSQFWSPRSTNWQIQHLEMSNFLDDCLFAATSLGGWTRELSQVYFRSALISNHLPKASSSNIITLVVMTSMCELLGTSSTESIAVSTSQGAAVFEEIIQVMYLVYWFIMRVHYCWLLLTPHTHGWVLCQKYANYIHVSFLKALGKTFPFLSIINRFIVAEKKAK